MKEQPNHLKLIINNRHIKKMSRMHNEFNRLTSGLIHIAHRDSRVSLIERDDDAVKVYFENRFVAVVREAEKHIELIAGNEGRDINVTRAEAGIATLMDVMREMAA